MHYQTSRAERASYSAYFVGQNIFYMLVTGFIALFLMNRGISEAAIAGVLLAPKIWDAVNDPIFGIIVDRSHLKGGKFLPWLKLSWVLIPVFTVFLFAMPEHIGYGAKVAWAATGYVLWSMSYTVCDAPIFALPTAMTSNVDERTSILSIGRLFATITSVVITLVVEAVYLSTGWLLLAVVLSAAAMGCMLPILLLAIPVRVIAVLVRVKLGSPVLYSATRIGKGEKPFKMYKFRSMTNERDENGELLPDAQRMTKFGSFLRATSADELPELFAILKGDMAFIGPRPMPIS